jgi:hypothetical protein
MRLAPVGDGVVAVAIAEHAAHRQQQRLRQGTPNTPGARIRRIRQMLAQRRHQRRREDRPEILRQGSRIT